MVTTGYSSELWVQLHSLTQPNDAPANTQQRYMSVRQNSSLGIQSSDQLRWLYRAAATQNNGLLMNHS